MGELQIISDEEGYRRRFKAFGDGSKIYGTAKIATKDQNIIIGKNCTICDFAFVAPRSLTMRYGSQIGMHAIIGGGGSVYLGKYSVVGPGAMLLPATDSTSAKHMCEGAPPKDRKIIRGSISLGDGAYIGAGAVVCVSEKCSHIIIGDNAVIGALTYVDRSIAPDTIIHPKQNYMVKRRWK